jgi:hypothetical protein
MSDILESKIKRAVDEVVDRMYVVSENVDNKEFDWALGACDEASVLLGRIVDMLEDEALNMVEER